MASVAKAGFLMGVVRIVALSLVSLFILALVLVPSLAGVHYLLSESYKVEGGYQNLRFCLVGILIFTNALTLLLMVWARFVDEG
jgi:hypothetical protein